MTATVVAAGVPPVPSGVTAVAHVEVAVRAGATAGPARTTLRLRSASPLVLRRTGPGRLHLVSVGAGPLGGDDLCLRVRVGARARLAIIQVAAAVALPGPDGRPSRMRYEIELGEHASLRWEGEPTVAGAGCDHASELHVTAAASACLSWRDEVVCGRHGEPSGVVRSRVTVVRAGRPALRTDACLGDAGWHSPAVGGGARVAGTLLLLGAAAEQAAAVCSGHAAVLRPADGVAVVTALGAGHPQVRAVLEAAGG
ncbi:MAG: urease accessory protein UreD [Euzebyales bacterium]|nr:urease accessory protein UreD [Euzebyales bacterium]